MKAKKSIKIDRRTIRPPRSLNGKHDPFYIFETLFANKEVKQNG